jgi:hypothetical protein
VTSEGIQLGNEAQVIASILAGEAGFFHDLIRPYERTVYIMILSVLQNEADAEDAAQETGRRIGHNQGSAGSKHRSEGARAGAVANHRIRESPVPKNVEHIDLVDRILGDNQELPVWAQNNIGRPRG